MSSQYDKIRRDINSSPRSATGADALSFLKAANQRLLVRRVAQAGTPLSLALFDYAMRDRREWNISDVVDLGRELDKVDAPLGEWIQKQENRRTK